MRIDVKIIPGAGRDQIKEEPGRLKVYVRAPAVDGRANEALLTALAGHFGVPPARVSIIKGLKSRTKIINIQDI